jgi:hypothetical protein
MYKLADLIEDPVHAEQLAFLDTICNGNPLSAVMPFSTYVRSVSSRPATYFSFKVEEC